MPTADVAAAIASPTMDTAVAAACVRAASSNAILPAAAVEGWAGGSASKRRDAADRALRMDRQLMIHPSCRKDWFLLLLLSTMSYQFLSVGCVSSFYYSSASFFFFFFFHILPDSSPPMLFFCCFSEFCSACNSSLCLCFLSVLVSPRGR